MAFALGAAALGAFTVVELRRNAAGRAVLLDLSLFRIGSFRDGNVLACAVSLGEFGLLFALPLWLENVIGYSAFRTGIALLPLAVGSFAASGLAVALARRLGPATAVRVGIGLEIAGVAGTGAVISATTPWWATIGPLFVYGAGVGISTTQLTGVVLADVPVERSGQGSGTQSASRQVGSALGIAILGTILFTVLGVRLSAALHSVPGLDTARQGQLVAAVKQSAGAAIPGLAASPATAHWPAGTARSRSGTCSRLTTATRRTTACRRRRDRSRDTGTPPARVPGAGDRDYAADDGGRRCGRHRACRGRY